MNEHAELMSFAKQLVEQGAIAFKKPTRKRKNPRSRCGVKGLTRHEFQTIPIAVRIPKLYKAILDAKGAELALAGGTTRPRTGAAIIAAIEEAGWTRQYVVEVERDPQEIIKLQERRELIAAARAKRKIHKHNP